MKSHFLLLLVLFNPTLFSRIENAHTPESVSFRKPILTGADQVERYLPYLKGKKVGILANQASIIGNKLIIDSLISVGVDIRMIFGPEHGFRSNASNGAKVGDEVYNNTAIPIVSLYGQKRKPSKKEMDSIDLM
ncbi:MAG TPA: exo-beta-N-acetylmuramidase NamZ domain-containing protein, partial [Puia sp.]|nr:exo-beta-N-acetylmuramidase NamZ domain-containing protein [Puia sp.]